MLAVDTNVVVRFLVKDDDAQAERTRAVVVNGPVYVAPTVILECDWVLRSLYGFSASQVVRALEAFCGIETVTVGEAGAVRRAFRMADAGHDFADALHLSLSPGCEAFATFDKRSAQRAATAGVPPVKLI